MAPNKIHSAPNGARPVSPKTTEPDRAPTATSEGRYTARHGDTVWSVCQRFGVSLPDVVALNKLPNPHQLATGQTLRLPPKSEQHGWSAQQAAGWLKSKSLAPSPVKQPASSASAQKPPAKAQVPTASATPSATAKALDAAPKSEATKEEPNLVMKVGHAISEGAQNVQAKINHEIERVMVSEKATPTQTFLENNVLGAAFATVSTGIVTGVVSLAGHAIEGAGSLATEKGREEFAQGAQKFGHRVATGEVLTDITDGVQNFGKSAWSSVSEGTTSERLYHGLRGTFEVGALAYGGLQVRAALAARGAKAAATGESAEAAEGATEAAHAAAQQGSEAGGSTSTGGAADPVAVPTPNVRRTPRGDPRTLDEIDEEIMTTGQMPRNVTLKR